MQHSQVNQHQSVWQQVRYSTLIATGNSLTYVCIYICREANVHLRFCNLTMKCLGIAIHESDCHIISHVLRSTVLLLLCPVLLPILCSPLTKNWWKPIRFIILPSRCPPSPQECFILGTCFLLCGGTRASFRHDQPITSPSTQDTRWPIITAPVELGTADMSDMCIFIYSIIYIYIMCVCSCM